MILNRRHLERILHVFVAHYNQARPHRGIDLEAPIAASRPSSDTSRPIQRTDHLGGLIHEYHRAA